MILNVQTFDLSQENAADARSIDSMGWISQTGEISEIHVPFRLLLEEVAQSIYMLPPPKSHRSPVVL